MVIKFRFKWSGRDNDDSFKKCKGKGRENGHLVQLMDGKLTIGLNCTLGRQNHKIIECTQSDFREWRRWQYDFNEI